MSTVPVRLGPPGDGSVDLYLPTVPRVGEHVHHRGKEWLVARVIHVVSTDAPFHVRVVLEVAP